MFRRSLLVCTFAFAATLLASCGGGGGGGAAAPTTPTPTTTVPAVPGAPTLTVNSATAISLSWTAVTSATTYEVWRHTGNDSAAATKQGGDTAVSTTSFADTGLTASTQYFYWLKACNTAGCSAFGARADANTQDPPSNAPNAPAAPTLVVGDDIEIALSWEAVATATRYEVFRSASDDSAAATEIGGDANITELTYTDTGLTADTKYFYFLKACLADECSDFSTSATATTDAALVSAPTSAATPAQSEATTTTDTAVALNWEAVGTARTYKVYRNTADSSNGAREIAQDVPATSYTDTSAAPSSSYFYWVVSCNRLGCSGFDGQGVELGTAPTSPAGVTASATSGTVVSLNWLAVEGAIRYEIWRHTEDDSSAAVEIGDGTDITALTYIDPDPAVAVTDPVAETDPVAGTEYFYWVLACDTATRCSAPAQKAVATTTAPVAPPSVAMIANPDASIGLTWEAAEGASRYRVWRHTADEVAMATEISTTATITSTSFTDSTTEAGAANFYWVSSCAATVCSAIAGAGVTITTPPGAPTALAVVAGSTDAALTWVAGATAARYEVLRSESDDGTTATEVGGDADITALTYMDTGLTAGTTYYYWVRSCTGEVCSAPSAGVNTGNLPSAPPAPAVVVEDEDSTVLTWTTIADAIRYEVWRHTADDSAAATEIGGDADIAALTYSDTALSAGTQYYYWLKACTAGATATDCSVFGPVTAVTTTPAPAAELTTAVSSDTAVAISWTEAADVTRYRILRGTTDVVADATELVPSTTITGTSYTDSGLTAGTQYYYWVRACTESGCSTPNPTALTATTAPVAPATAPESATVTTATATITWAEVTGAASYELYRGTSPDASEATTIGGDTAITAATYDDTELTAGTVYYYWVKACDAATACSGFSAPLAISTTPADAEAPVAAMTDTTSVALTWTEVPGAIRYEVFRADADDSTMATEIGDTADITGLGYTDSALTAATTYYYWVKACAAGTDNCSALTTSATVTTAIAAPTAAPTLAVDSDTAITATWTAVESADRYEIWRHIANNSRFAFEIGGDADITELTLADTGLSAGTTYYYWLKACAGDLCSDFSAPATATTSGTGQGGTPEAPISLTATALSHVSISLSWPMSATATTYDVYRGDTGDSLMAEKLTTDTVNTDLVFVDSGLTAETEYFYWVQACLATNCSGFSDLAKATTLATPTSAPGTPAVPTVVTGTLKGNTLSLEWTRTEEADDYEVWRHTADMSGAATKISGETNINGLRYDDTGLDLATGYFYWLKACNNVGCSEFNTAALNVTTTATATPAVPNTPTTSAVTSSSITVNWALVTSATSYEVWRNTADMSGAATMLTTTNDTAVSYVDSTPMASTTYFYWVKACISTDCSDFSASVTVDTMAPPPGAPGAPGALTLTPNSTTQITLTWVASSTSGVTYDVFRQASGGSDTKIHTTAVSVLTYVDSGLTESTSYTYRVVACMSSLCSTPSTQTASTMSAPPPAAPGALSLTVESATQIAVRWGTSSTLSVVYELDRGLSATNFANIQSDLANADFTDTGLSASTTYFYRVRACLVSASNRNCSGYTAATSSMTTAVMTTVDVPVLANLGSVTLMAGTEYVVASPGAGQVLSTFTFVNSGGAELTGCAVMVGSGLPANLSVVTTADQSSCVIIGTPLSNRASTQYSIIATNAGGTSNAATVTLVIQGEPLTPPTNIAVTASVSSTASASLSWTKFADSSIRYGIYGSATNQSSTAMLIDESVGLRAETITGIVNPSNPSGALLPLARGTTYYFWIKSIQAPNESDFSASVSYTVPFPRPEQVRLSLNGAAVRVDWTAVPNVGNYRINRDTDANPDGSTFVGSAFATDTFANDSGGSTGLDDGETYFYWIRACGTTIESCSEYSPVAEITIVSSAPDTPTPPTAVVQGTTEIRVIIPAIAGAVESYDIYRHTTSDSSAAESLARDYTGTTYSDTGLMPNTQYYYFIRANNTVGTSAFSDGTLATTDEFIPTPQAPVRAPTLTVLSDTEIAIRWTGVSNATFYQVFSNAGASSSSPAMITGADNVTLTRYTHTGLTAETLYFYRIKACNTRDGESSCSALFSPEASARTLPEPPDAPTSPTSATVTNTAVELAWSAITGQPNVNYLLLFRSGQNNASTAEQIFRDNNPVDAQTYTNGSLVPTTTYFYWLQACTINDICSDFSMALEVTTSAPATAASAAPEAPTTSAVTSSSITLSWTAVTEATRYFVFRGNTSTAGSAENLAEVTSPTYVNSELEGGRTYYYWVISCNVGNCSTFSPSVSQQTQNPAAPDLANITGTQLFFFGETYVDSSPGAGERLTPAIFTNSGGDIQSNGNCGVLSGTLPDGLTAERTKNLETCAIVGTPNAITSTSVTVTVQGTNGMASDASVTVEVVAQADSDSDGLIDITTVEQLHNIRFDLAGASLKTSETDSGNDAGCPNSGCIGYELLNDIDFDRDGDGRTWTGNIEDGYTLDAGDTSEIFTISDSATAVSGFAPIEGVATFDFEGNGFTIRNMIIRHHNNVLGFVSTRGGTSNFRNFGLVNLLIDALPTRTAGGVEVGGVWGRTDSGNSHVRTLGVFVTGDIVIRHSVTSPHYIGGIAGNMNTSNLSTIRASFTDVNIYNFASSPRAYIFIGGLAGASGGIISISHANGTITAQKPASLFKRRSRTQIGGILGAVAPLGARVHANYSTVDAFITGYTSYSPVTPVTAQVPQAASNRVYGSVREGRHNQIGALASASKIGGNNSEARLLTLVSAGEDWNQMVAITPTLGAWDFGDNMQNPQVSFADFDGGANAAFVCGAELPCGTPVGYLHQGLLAPKAMPNIALGSQTTLTWQDVAGASRYQIYRGSAVDNLVLLNGETEVTDNTYTDVNTTANSTYYYSIRACDANKCSGFSDETKVVFNADYGPLPATLTGITSIRQDSGEQLTVMLPTQAGVTSYEVWRSTTGAGRNAATRVAAGVVGSFTDENLTISATYDYYIKACNLSKNCVFTSTTAEQQNTVADSDGDGLIEISSIRMLYNVRFNIRGTGYKTGDSAPNISTNCGGGTCNGYELIRNIDFDTDGDGRTWFARPNPVNGEHTGEFVEYGIDNEDSIATYFPLNDRSATTYREIANEGWTPLGLESRFDGKGFAIRNVVIRSNFSDVGLFSGVGNGGRILNLGVEDALVLSTRGAAANVGILLGGQYRVSLVLSSYSTGEVVRQGNTHTGDISLGGLVGAGNNVQFTDDTICIASYSNSIVRNLDQVPVQSTQTGGLVGRSSDAQIYTSYHTGEVFVADKGDARQRNFAGTFAGGGESGFSKVWVSFSYTNMRSAADFTSRFIPNLIDGTAGFFVNRLSRVFALGIDQTFGCTVRYESETTEFFPCDGSFTRDTKDRFNRFANPNDITDPLAMTAQTNIVN
ncbi:MAG: fibronectin type III domain-containing protein, partial [Gammaproteobacteria bacterium]|nr:fibronectin type III domain-containing protein [Gammaproteobacteria bacterium]